MCCSIILMSEKVMTTNWLLKPTPSTNTNRPMYILHFVILTWLKWHSEVKIKWEQNYKDKRNTFSSSSSSSSSNLLRSRCMTFSSYQFLPLFPVFGYFFECQILSFHQVAQQVHSLMKQIFFVFHNNKRNLVTHFSNKVRLWYSCICAEKGH